jgi:drug/metabolite transporter (DMT)-like permease
MDRTVYEEQQRDYTLSEPLLTQSPSPPPATIDADLQKGSNANRMMVFWSSLALFIAVVSMSATGPLFLYLQTRGLKPILSCAWRNQTMLLFLIPPAVWEWRQIPKSKRSWEAMRVKEDDTTGGGASGKSHSSPKEKTMKESPPHSTRSNSNATSGAAGARSVHGDRHADSVPSWPSPAHAASSTSRRHQKDWHVSWYLLAVSITWAGSLVLWVVALPYTSTPRASLFCSTYPLLLVPYMKYVQKIPVSVGETVGVVIAFLGIVVSEMDSLAVGAGDASPDGMESVQLSASKQAGYLASESVGLAPMPGAEWTFAQRQLYGDSLCIGASLLLGLNILFAEKTRKVLPLFTYSASSAMVVLVMLMVGSFALEGSSISMDPRSGLFGWVQSEWLALMVAFGFIVGCIGILGFNFAVKYVSPSVTRTHMRRHIAVRIEVLQSACTFRCDEISLPSFFPPFFSFLSPRSTVVHIHSLLHRVQSPLQLHPTPRSRPYGCSLLAGRSGIPANLHDLPRHHDCHGRDRSPHDLPAEEGEEGGAGEEEGGRGTGGGSIESLLQIEHTQTAETVLGTDVAERLCAQHAEDRQCGHADEPGVKLRTYGACILRSSFTRCSHSSGQPRSACAQA